MGTDRDGHLVSADLHVCTACGRDFVVPVSVLGLVEPDRCVVELRCTNCGAVTVGVHDDRDLIELDRHLDEGEAQIREALEILQVSEELGQVDRFVRALRGGHNRPEDP